MLSFWNKQRLFRFFFAFLIALITAVFIKLPSVPSFEGMLGGGDFAAYYSGAKLTETHDLPTLYSHDSQQQSQLESWGDTKGLYHYFAYPPFVAVILKPLTYFSPKLAKNIFSALMFFLLLISSSITARFISDSPFSNLTLSIIFFTFAPNFISILSGQNTALSIFCLTTAIHFAMKNKKQGDFIAGIFLGFWLFKPQFAITAIAISSIALGRYLLLGATIPALTYYLIAAKYFSATWLIDWVDIAINFHTIDLTYNSHQMISIEGFIFALTKKTTLITKSLTLICSAAILLPILKIALAGKKSDNSNQTIWRKHLPTLLPLIITLISPHSMFYDFGICLIPILTCSNLNSDKSVSYFILLYLLTFLCVLTKDLAPVGLLTILSLVLLTIYTKAITQKVTEASYRLG